MKLAQTLSLSPHSSSPMFNFCRASTYFGIIPLLLSAFFGAGCAVDLELEQSGVFLCESDEDCLGGYICDLEVNRCIVEGMIAPIDCAAIDPDADRFVEDFAATTQEERIECQLRQGVDCDPNNPQINPSATEVCDGEDNDCDSEVDEPVSCQSASECGQPPPEAAGDLRAECANDQICIFVPFNANDEECPEEFREVRCMGGQLSPPLAQIPGACK